MSCKRPRVQISSSPLTENAAGIELVAFVDGVTELRFWGLTRYDPLGQLKGL
jgi:hypothetical protein